MARAGGLGCREVSAVHGFRERPPGTATLIAIPLSCRGPRRVALVGPPSPRTCVLVCVLWGGWVVVSIMRLHGGFGSPHPLCVAVTMMWPDIQGCVCTHTHARARVKTLRRASARAASASQAKPARVPAYGLLDAADAAAPRVMHLFALAEAGNLQQPNQPQLPQTCMPMPGAQPTRLGWVGGGAQQLASEPGLQLLRGCCVCCCPAQSRGCMSHVSPATARTPWGPGPHAAAQG